MRLFLAIIVPNNFIEEPAIKNPCQDVDLVHEGLLCSRTMIRGFLGRAKHLQYPIIADKSLLTSQPLIAICGDVEATISESSTPLVGPSKAYYLQQEERLALHPPTYTV
jgi:hypothetical protein